MRRWVCAISKQAAIELCHYATREPHNIEKRLGGGGGAVVHCSLFLVFETRQTDRQTDRHGTVHRTKGGKGTFIRVTHTVGTCHTHGWVHAIMYRRPQKVLHSVLSALTN